MARNAVPGEKPLYWVGSFEKGPAGVSRESQGPPGHCAECGAVRRKTPGSKPWKGEGPGIFEVVEDSGRATYRAVYTVRYEAAVYVLHAFQKKSPTGIKTSGPDIGLVSRRLRIAQRDYEERYGKAKK